MITHIEGRLVEKNPAYAIIDCHGVGYLIYITLYTFEKIPNQENIKLFTYFMVREDSQMLYGFYESAEREMFKLLINVNGIGPSAARMILSTLAPDSFQKAVLDDDVNTLKSVKGIGVKSAQRIIIELKDKISKTLVANDVYLPGENKIKQEALNALEVLGFTRKQVEKKITRLIEQNSKISLEELIKLTLKEI